MVGVTMLLVMAICIFGAAALYAALSRPFSDLVPNAAPSAPISAASTQNNEPAEEAPAPAIETEPTAAAVPEVEAAPESEPTVAPSNEDFDPTHQIGAGTSVNFRAGPSTSDSIIVSLPPATPLEYLDEEEPTDNPADGDSWMRFRTEDGQEGWIREIDTVSYQP
jgi:hypothetical protein